MRESIKDKKINILWHDPNIANLESAIYIQDLIVTNRLESIEQTATVQQTLKKIEHMPNKIDIVLTSGNNGQPLVLEIEKAVKDHSISVIVFCQNVEFHKEWASKTSIVRFVTKDFNQVIRFVKNFTARNRFLSENKDFLFDYETEANPKFKESFLNLHDKYKQEFGNKVEDRMEEKWQLMNQMAVEDGHTDDEIKFAMTLYENENPMKLFTRDTYFYTELNNRFRTIDYVQIKPIFDFCIKLSHMVNRYNQKLEGIDLRFKGGKLYRMINLSEKDMDYIRKSPNGKIKLTFTTFVSLSKNLTQAIKNPGNTLLTIQVGDKGFDPKYVYPIDISSLSHFPLEEEVLILPGPFLVRACADIQKLGDQNFECFCVNLDY